MTELYNVREGKYGRDDRHPYRDVELQVEAEIDRARAEGREPDFDNLQPAVSTVLVEHQNLPTRQYTDRNQRYDGVQPVEVLDGPIFTPAGLNPEVDLSQAAQIARERLIQAEALAALADADAAAASAESGTTEPDASTNDGV